MITEIRYALYAWMGLGVLVFFLLNFITAPYGRHSRKGWGPMVSERLAWVLMEFPSLAILLYFLVKHWSSPIPALILAGAWVLHYIYRTFIFPLLLRPGPKGTPVSIIFMSQVFNTINALFNGFFLFMYPPTGFSLRFASGLFILIAGFAIHVWADHRLRVLRKPGETEYKIPVGGLFNYVSSPNYLGEIVEWTGFAIAAWNLAALAFLLWTIANLVPRALAHHRWYKKQFSDYPSDRKALIPFIL